MSPVRGCPKCGRPRCTRHAGRPRAGAGERRSYSDTAAYRAMRAVVLETYGSDCFYGDGPIDLEPGATDPLVLAHVVAHADGGAFELENLRPAHASCNNRAGRRQTPGDQHG